MSTNRKGDTSEPVIREYTNNPITTSHIIVSTVLWKIQRINLNLRFFITYGFMEIAYTLNHL